MALCGLMPKEASKKVDHVMGFTGFPKSNTGMLSRQFKFSILVQLVQLSTYEHWYSCTHWQHIQSPMATPAIPTVDLRLPVSDAVAQLTKAMEHPVCAHSPFRLGAQCVALF